MSADSAVKDSDQRHVRVWFGQHLVCDYTAEPAAAERYAAAMARQFTGLRVTTDAEVDGDLRRLPCELLWSLAP